MVILISPVLMVDILILPVLAGGAAGGVTAGPV